MGRLDRLVTDRATVVAKPMEDRKRTVPHENSDEHPSKRQALSGTMAAAASKSPAVPQTQEDVVHFQKEAIWRQMQEYKRERNMLEERVDELEKKSKYHDDHLRITDSWWEQLLDEVRLLTGKSVASANGHVNGDTTAFPSSLLFDDIPSFSDHLSKKRTQITDSLNALFKALKQTTEPPSDRVKELQSELSRLLESEKAHQVDIERLQKEKDDVNARLTETTIKYMTAAKKLDRIKSITVQKIERQAMHQATSSGSGGENSSGGSKEDEHAASIPEGQLADIEQARKEAQAIASKQKEELQQLQADNTRLSEQLTNFTIKFTRLSEDDISNCDIFKNLKLKLEDIVARYNHIEALNTQLREEAAKLQAERAAYKETLDNENQTQLIELQSQLTRAEHDVARIRTARDEYMQELQTRKANDDGVMASTKEVKDLAEVRATRIQSLELEIARLKARLETEAPEANKAIAELSPEALATKYDALEKAYNALTQELGPLEAAYKKADELSRRKIDNLIDKDEKIQKLQAEKAKTDQRYFTAMKTKEALQGENRVLKIQNGKSSEIITQLKEAEKSAIQLVANLEKQIADYKASQQAQSLKAQESQRIITEHGNTIESLKRQVDELSISLKHKDSALAKEANARREAGIEVEKLQIKVEDLNRLVESERSRGSESSQITSLKQLCLCPVCKTRWKQAAVRTCGHLFCKPCIDERVSSRSRKCPTCGKAFAPNDIFPVHM